MSKLQALREKRVTLAKSMRALADKMNAEGYVASGEDEANWEKINNDYNTTLRAVEREEIADTAERAAIEVNGEGTRNRISNFKGGQRAKGNDGANLTDDVRALGLGAWMKARCRKDLTDEEQQAMDTVGLSAHQDELAFKLLPTAQHRKIRRKLRGLSGSAFHDAAESLPEFGANLSNQSGPSGGFLVPPTNLLQSLEINLLAYGGMFQASETITTSAGERMAWPVVDDTTNKGYRLGANAQIITTSTTTTPKDPTFGQVYWDAYKYSSATVLVPTELIEDAVTDVPGMLGELLGIRLGRIMNDEFTNGTGNNMPMGLVTKCSLGGALATPSFVTSLVAATLGADDIFNLYHQVDPAYRVGNGLGFMMHDKILLAVRKLKDGNGQYLFNSGAFYGRPDQLIGESIFINQSMTTSQATGGFPLLWGQLSKYKIRRVREVRVYHLKERYRDFDQDAFLCLARADGNLLTAGTPPVAALKMS